jgi:hypothetical protein
MEGVYAKQFEFDLQLKLLIVTAAVLGHWKLVTRLQISYFALYMQDLATGVIASSSAGINQI